MSTTRTGVQVLSGACVAALAYAAFRPLWMWKLRKLQGPPALPLLGNLHQILAHGDITSYIALQVTKYGSVFKVWNGMRPWVIIHDPELIRKFLLINERHSLEMLSLLQGEDRQINRSGLLDLNPAEHGIKFRIMRKAFEQAVLNPQPLAEHAVMLPEVATRLVKHLSRYAATGEPVDVSQVLPEMTMDAIGMAAFGLDFDCFGIAGGKDLDVAPYDGPWYEAPVGSAEFSRGLVRVSRAIFRYADVANSTPWKAVGMFFPALYHVVRVLACNVLTDQKLRDEMQTRKELRLALHHMVDEWKSHKTSGDKKSTGISDRGFLSKLMESMDKDQGVTEIDVIAQAFTMTLGGYETTAAGLAACLYLISNNPKAQARLHEELDDVLKSRPATADDLINLPYLCGVFDEALRLYPPATAAVRRLRENVKLADGKIIPENAFVWLNIYTLQRDPAIWPKPDDFLPERHVQPGNEHLAPNTTYAYLPFGGGPRMCVGYKFALLEARLALSRLFQVYTIHPVPDMPEPKWTTGIAYVADHVWVKVTPRCASVTA